MDSQPTTTPRPAAPWRILPWLGVLLTASSFFTSGWRAALGFALATVGMFISARADFTTNRWAKLAALALAIAAVVVWTVL